MFRIIILISSLVFCISSFASSYPIVLSHAQTERLADLIWENEGIGKVENLTVWNKSEDFPSMGIGHFIWYPTLEKGPYVEQFPALLAYLQAEKVDIPNWLTTAKVAPWESREAFYAAYNKSELTELRSLMQSTISLQAKFIIKRLEAGIPNILSHSNLQQKEKIDAQLSKLTATPEGIFVLLDYINFKGEGISKEEEYRGQGWGLKQVLLAMPENPDDALLSFALAADEMLTRRVKNAPRDEIHWLKGWRVRVHKYPHLTI